MSIVMETEIRKLRIEMRKELADLKKIICNRMVADKWIKQDVACILLNIKPRQLYNIRIHLNEHNAKTGSIGWKKGKGKSCLYYLPDIEKYNSAVTIMN